MTEHDSLTYEPGNERDRDDILVTVASLYYDQNQNQQQIADRLEISRSSVSRMIKEARDRGIVEIQIKRPLYRNYQLEQALLDRFGIRDAYVLLTGNLGEADVVLNAIGRLAASYLNRVIDGLPPGSSIGIAWGTGAYAAANALSVNQEKQIDVVQLLGSVGAPNPLIDGPDLARMLASKLGGRHFYLHAPVLVEQNGLRDMLYRESAVRDALARIDDLAAAVTGIGTVQPEASSFLRTGHLTVAELEALQAQGIVGETCGRFFDQNGRSDGYEINEHVVGIELDALQKIPRVVAVAHGLPKVKAILGALRGKLMTVLCTDDVTAQAILAADGAPPVMTSDDRTHGRNGAV